MTREEQTEWLCRLRTDLNNGVVFTPWNKEFTEALTGILDQETCDDAISRQAVLDMASTIQTDDSSGNEILDVVEVDDIKALPPVTPQPVAQQQKTGRWIHNKCDKCGASRPPLFDNYCPNCGAKMEVKE